MRFKLTLISLFAFVSINAFAQNQRSFVASSGLDSNPCTRQAPCRNFNAAMATTIAGGEVVALDSAGYGQVTITQSISLVAPNGVHAAIAVPAGTGISINAPGSTVILRGLYVNFTGGSNAIQIYQGATVSVQGVTANNFVNGSGLDLGQTDLIPTEVAIKDSLFRGNFFGVLLDDSHSQVTAAIEHTRFDDNAGHGIMMRRNVKLTLSDSHFFRNNESAIQMDPSEAGPSILNVENCVISDSSHGFNLTPAQSDTSVTLRLSNTMIVNTDSALYRGGASSGSNTTVYSWGNNRIAGNGDDGTIDVTVPQR